MIFSRSRRSIFPLLPPYGAHDPDGERITTVHPDDLTPYLGLRARLSQVWINRWTILLLLVLVRVLIAIGSLQNDMATAKREALSSCTSVESMGSAMASMPHYLSQGVNDMTATGFDKAVNGLKSMLLLTITGVEEIIVFIIKIMYQTYLCLVTMAVRGTVSAAIALIKDALDFLNSTLSTIGHDIDATVSTFETGLEDFANLVNTAANDLGAHLPTLNLNTSVDALENIHLPQSIDAKLNTLNSSIPTFNEADSYVQDLIRAPFQEINGLINQSLGTYSFDRTLLPVPEKKQLTFCGDNDGINNFFQGVDEVAVMARKIFIIVMLIAAVLACIPVAWKEIRRWRSMKERSQLVRKEAHDPMDVVYIVSRPYTAAAGIKAASRFSNSRRQTLVRWAIAYATTMPALFVLALGIAGLLGCLCQWLLLRAVQKTVPELSSEVTAFADKVVSSLENASVAWADGANQAITHMNNDINDNVFGWVNKSTHAVNNTLNSFVDKTMGVLNETFQDTILYDPITEVFQCLIGLKIEGIEKGLTWVSDHAHVDFPLLPSNVFSSGAAASISNSSNPSDSFLADAGSDTSNKISQVVVSVVSKLEDGVRQEAMIATAVVAIWVLVALIGATRAMILFWGRDRNRGEGGGHAIDPVPRAPYPASDFMEVPLTAAPKNQHDSFARMATAPAVSARGGPVSIDDEKYGFAGHRTYNAALNVDSAPAVRGSTYVEYDVKRGI
ncbi:plasma membrane fusion protein prm1 [Penicillium riverlandense]|uniref:plasma membrane fusion protein prm1 n=1 Tax=Penicillium riverlandense TaxID=1903569 RepID=UPI0025472A29|nr:plasma membrane fusion protein prm1 [Penicillium riverlandense]KAJ5815121.1 plasma membrane fusion protein prm1 [Penicillium riverlandense]